jgi:hypothetical protein
VAIDQGAQGGHAGLAPARRERPPQPVRIDEVELVGLVDGGFQLLGREALGQVEQRAHDACDRDAVGADKVAVRNPAPVQPDSPGRPPWTGHRDVDRTRSAPPNAERLARRLMTQRRAGPGAQNGSNEDTIRVRCGLPTA